MIPGGISVRGARAGDPVPHVAPPGGLHGHAAQERRGREAPLQVRAAERQRRHRQLLHHLPGGGYVANFINLVPQWRALGSRVQFVLKKFIISKLAQDPFSVSQ